MIERINNFIKDNKFNIDKPIVCAVSGGVDSVFLIYALKKLGYNVILAHVNHHKRIESEMEEKAMQEFANELNVPFELLNYHYSGAGNFHAEAHEARYKFFRSVADKYNTNIIATAHHLNDQIETILIKLLEGSNLYGYGGMPFKYNDGKYIIIRPLLCLKKEEIYEYCNLNNIKYFEDSSNQSDEFLRNRIRHHIVPLLLNECNDLYDKTFKYSKILHESFDYIRNESIKYLNDNLDTINTDSFNNLDVAIKKDIISLLLEKYEINRNTKIIEDILLLLENKNGSKELSLEKDYLLIKEYNKCFITNINTSIPKEESFDLDNYAIFDNKYKIYFSKIKPSNNAKYIKLCYNQLSFPFIVRGRKDGDYIGLLNGTKKVSRVLIDNKVPKRLRDNIPLILDGKGNIIWIYDYLKSDLVYKQKESGDIYLVCEVL